VLTGVLAPTGLNVIAAPVDRGARITPLADISGSGLGAAEHRYRIVGKLRLALFWVSRDDVGSARMSWRSDGGTSALALLLGSDPQRAPRRLNQWGYLREEAGRGSAEVFSLRSVDGDGDDPGGFAIGDGPEFDVSCAAVGGDEVSSWRTRVNARGVTYRMFDQLLDRITASRQWEQRHMPRPSGAAPGFLTAMQHAMQLGETAARDRGIKKLRPVTYVYNNAVYDLTMQGRESLGRTAVGTRTFEQLIRTEFSIRNRTTGDITKFGLTYSPEDAAAPLLPVQIFYQPSFWLRIELRLDDNADVPTDPAADGAMLDRIRALCAH
jgi:hypothetical protein